MKYTLFRMEEFDYLKEKKKKKPVLNLNSFNCSEKKQ